MPEEQDDEDEDEHDGGRQSALKKKGEAANCGTVRSA